MNQNTKYEVLLRYDLSEKEKKMAYLAMDLVYIDYKREHCVSWENFVLLHNCKMLASWKPVMVMH